MQSNALARTFNHPRVFLPVLHLPHGVQGGLESARIAVEAGADGVFLINQGMSVEGIVQDLLPALREQHPHLWVGANFLGCSPRQALRASSARVQGLWADDAGVDALDESRADTSARALREARSEHAWAGLYFGGTAFKTQMEIVIDKLPWVAKRAAEFVDVVTTSGPGTGKPASLAKVIVMRHSIPDVALALASGVTPENVDQYLPHVDAYLVASGIERGFGILDSRRTQLLADKIHGYRP